jgi:predicted transcriptional regulator
MTTSSTTAWNEIPIEGLMQRPITLSGKTRIDDAIAQLQDTQSHCLLILRDDGRLAGVFREEDVLNRILGMNLSGEEPVARFIDPEYFSLKVSANVTQVIDIMGQKGLRYVPLVDVQGFPIGIFSIRELIYYIAEQTTNQNGRFSTTAKEGAAALGTSGEAILEVLNLPISFALSRFGFNNVIPMRTNESISRALKLFRGSSQLAALLFEEHQLCGLFRLRDLPFKVLRSTNLEDQPVRVFMTDLPEVINESETIGSGLARMAKNRVLFLHYQMADHRYGLISGSGLISYLYDHIHDDF